MVKRSLKGLNKSPLRGLNKSSKGLKVTGSLSSEQAEILRLLTEEYLTPKQIAHRRKTSYNSTYKIIAKLKHKGLINRGLNKLPCTRTRNIKPPPSLPVEYWRLHGQEFSIRIIYKSKFYEQARGRGNTFWTDEGHTVRMYKDSLEVYADKLKWFEHADMGRASAMSWQYWNTVLKRLENRLKITIIKAGVQNVGEVKCHWAHVENGIAKAYNDSDTKFNLYASEDGKLWATVDMSHKKNELEFQHTETAKRDGDLIVNKHFNAIRDNPEVPNVAEFSKLLKETLKIVKNNSSAIGDIATGLNIIVETLKPEREPVEKEGLGGTPYYCG